MENNWWQQPTGGKNIGPQRCPECGDDFSPSPFAPCHCPNMIYIPPGQHIHVDCPRHGKIKLYGSPVTFS